MVAQQAPVNGAPTDPATALFREKLRLSESLNCRDLLADLERVDGQLVALVRGHAELDQQIAAAKGAIAEAETLATVAIEGKNEAERKTNRALALQKDVAYQNACLELRRAEAQLARHDADLDAAKRQARRVEKAIDYRVAALRFLGG